MRLALAPSTLDAAQVPWMEASLTDIADHCRLLAAARLPQLRQAQAELLLAKIQALYDDSARRREPLRTEVDEAVRRWEAIAQYEVDAVRRPGELHRWAFPGGPVDRDGEAYLPRQQVIRELERHIRAASGCRAMVLYSGRRMGKSTVLENLRGELHNTVDSVVVSMQDPEMFEGVATFCAGLGRLVLPDSLPPEDLRGLFRHLGERNESLKAADRRLLIAIDEYEMIDEKIGEGVFTVDVLATLRESIQTHGNITWLLAGSHQIADLRHAPWESYLVGARTIEVPPFTLAETRTLLTEPGGHPSIGFTPEFWGPGGIERIQEETAGWPHLVQLLAATSVDLANETPGCAAMTADMLNESIQRALVYGHQVFYELLHRECVVEGEWEYIEGFREREWQDPPRADIATSLRRRELVDVRDGRWRLRVPLMRRWLIERG
jgi:hypothetical protein